MAIDALDTASPDVLEVGALAALLSKGLGVYKTVHRMRLADALIGSVYSTASRHRLCD